MCPYVPMWFKEDKPHRYIEHNRKIKKLYALCVHVVNKK